MSNLYSYWFDGTAERKEKAEAAKAKQHHAALEKLRAKLTHSADGVTAAQQLVQGRSIELSNSLAARGRTCRCMRQLLSRSGSIQLCLSVVICGPDGPAA